MTEAAGPNTGWRHWLIYASYTAAAGMVICFSVILIQVLLWLYPKLDIRGTLFVCAVVVLEAFFSFWLIKQLPTAQRQIAYYRGTELILLMVGLKLFTELRGGLVNLWNNFHLWPVQFPFNILTIQYLLTILPVLVSWWIGNLFAADLSLLGTEDAAILDDRLKTTPVHIMILRRFLSLGIFIVLLASIFLLNISPMSESFTFKPASVVVAYFVLGIILLSLTRYITLETSWWQARLHIPIQIPRRWFAYSALILSIIVFLVSWMPTKFRIGLFDTLNAVLIFLSQLVLVLYGLILLILSLPARLLSSILPDSQISVPAVAPPTENLLTPGIINNNWDLVKSIFLWGSLIILVILALRQYISFHRDLAEELRRFRPLRWFLALWERFKASVRKVNKSIGLFIQNSLDRLRSAGPVSARLEEWDFINPRRLPARQKVIFYYLAMIRRAREAGIPRREEQTPYEYAHLLNSSLQTEKDWVDAMTESFIEARYSRHTIQEKTARRAETVWESIRQVLIHFRRSLREEKTRAK
jgi:hypothetical protein